MITVEFVAVVYNNVEDTKDFVASISKMVLEGVDVSCILVDNSDDINKSNELNILPEIYSFVKVMAPGRNAGYFGGFNFYFQNKSPSKDKFVILCNNDLVFNQDFLAVLSTSTYPDDVLVVCPDVVTSDGYHQNPHVKKKRNFFQRTKHDIYFSNYFIARFFVQLKKIYEFIKNKKIHEAQGAEKSCFLHMGIGACYVLTPQFMNVFDRLHYPHFLYGEEAYLSNQVLSAGGRLYYDSELKVVHKESATLSKLPKFKTYAYAKESYWSHRSYY